MNDVLAELKKALKQFPKISEKETHVEISDDASIKGLIVATVECAFCGHKKRNDIFPDRREEWLQLGKKNPLCPQCSKKLKKIFDWLHDLEEKFAGFDGKVLVDQKQLEDFRNTHFTPTISGYRLAGQILEGKFSGFSVNAFSEKRVQTEATQP